MKGFVKMNTIKKIGFGRLVAGIVLALPLLTSSATAAPPVPTTPTGVKSVVVARPFVMDQSFTHHWQMEKPSVRGGWVLVLDVDRDLVYPRQTMEPVLYVGDQVAQRVNVGYRSGKVVAVVPSPLDEQGNPTLDLTKATIFFGTPELPERVDVRRIKAEQALAAEAGITARPAAELAQARQRGGQFMALTDEMALTRQASVLIRQYSPQEAELADLLEMTIDQ
jgi:hypothetical protein